MACARFACNRRRLESQLGIDLFGRRGSHLSGRKEISESRPDIFSRLYKQIWDAFGRLMYTSTPEDRPITAVSWSPDGQMLALGFFNGIRLCDGSGVGCSVVFKADIKQQCFCSAFFFPRRLPIWKSSSVAASPSLRGRSTRRSWPHQRLLDKYLWDKSLRSE